ncbi:MAG: EamA family transporter [Candidatus Heimdallarchaeota archaeon]|nr:MAG: EamA family transporter [Candidatus Heimdallarchaeota archaeon]
MDVSEPKFKYQISLIVATIAVSWASIFISFLLDNGVPPVIIAFWRVFLSVMFLFPLFSRQEIRNQFRPYFKLTYQRFFALSGFFLSLHFFSWIQSLEFLSVAASVIVVNSSPIWVIVFSFILFQEKITIQQFIGLIIGFFGLFLISMAPTPHQDDAIYPQGIILALFGAVMVAFYFMIGKRMRSQHTVPNIPYVFFVNLFCAGFLFLFSFLLSVNVLNFTLEDLVWFIALAIGPSLLGHALYTYSMKHLSAQTVSLAVIGETVGASLLAWFILSQDLPTITLIGGVLVLIGIYLNVRYDISSIESNSEGKSIDSS